MVRFLWYSFLFVFLSILTQIGGAVFLLSLFFSKLVQLKFRGNNLLVFTTLYLIFTFLIIPAVASKFGREKIKNATPTNFATVLLNRNYVKPELNSLLQELNSNINCKVNYLDASFPFYDGFPLLPHLSHNDGKKLDISLVYETADGVISNRQKSISGYGVFEGPKSGEQDQITMCKDAGYFQYDYPKYLTFGSINKELRFSEKGTKTLIESILKFDSIEKIFIEPHLVARLKLNHPRIRYHGCRAVRHDDHIHIQIK